VNLLVILLLKTRYLNHKSLKLVNIFHKAKYIKESTTTAWLRRVFRLIVRRNSKNRMGWL